jgi:hypothetical protein
MNGAVLGLEQRFPVAHNIGYADRLGQDDVRVESDEELGAGSPARKLVLLLPNEVITTGMTDLACAYRAGAVDRAVDD